MSAFKVEHWFAHCSHIKDKQAGHKVHGSGRGHNKFWKQIKGIDQKIYMPT